ncbi:MAG: tripartite tricarboxylate transporter substrate binding protein [Pseudomonadota bacterium]|jgi:tripartite-type tricarboxylate transporter receptor subunit TctC
MKRPILLSGIAIAAALTFSSQTHAQTWPTRPVRMMVAFPPGTPGDVTLRTIGERVGNGLGQVMVVENKPGAGGNVGAETVANAAPDGYTVLEGPDTIFSINPLVYGKLNFKPDSLVPLTTLVTFSQMLVCHPSVGVKSVAELTALAKTKSLNYASGGVGVPGHLVMEMYLAASGTQMVHVPYKGPAPAAQDLLAGQVACAFLVTNAVAPHVKAGRLTGLAMSGRKRSNLVPQVPTMQEAGVPNFDATFSEMLYVPKGTPPEVMQRIYSEVNNALAVPEIREKLAVIDATPVGMGPEEAAKRVRDETERWTPVVRKLGLKLE